MAETKTNNLGAVQGNLTAAYNARKKRDDLYKKGYAVSPDKAKRDEYAAVGAEMDSNYNTGFQEIRRLEEEAKSIPKFRSLTSADRERAQKIKEIKKQIPLQTILAQELLPKGLVRSREIAPLQEDTSAKEVDLTEGETPAIKVSKPKRKIEKLYRVMYAGKGAEASETYETKEEADAALKRAGGKGAVAGINMSQETRGGEILPIKDVQARKQGYMDQLSKTKEISKSESDRLKKIQALRNPQTEEEILQVAENKGRMEEALVEANKAKRSKDKEAGAGFADWISDVKTVRDVPERQLNEYSKNMSLLNNAYREAIKEKRYLAARDINEDIKEYSRGVPKEMGARQRYAREGLLKSKEKEMADYIRRKQEAQEAAKKTTAANSDYQQFNTQTTPQSFSQL